MSEPKSNWKSSLLETLGVKGMAVSTPKAESRGYSLALAAAITLALGGVSLGAQAEERIKKETSEQAASATAYSVIGIEDGDSGFERTTKVMMTVGQVLMSPQTEVLSLAGQAAVGSAAGATTKSSSKGKYAAELVGTVAGIAVAAPVFGVLMGANQVHNTYVFIQDEQEKAVKLKMEDVADRVADVQASHVQLLRLEERNSRETWPEDRKNFDQKTMYDAVVQSEVTGIALTESQQIRYDLEKHLAQFGGTPEPWFARFNQDSDKINQLKDDHQRQMLAGVESSPAGFRSITDNVVFSAGRGAKGLSTSNKGFLEYAQEESKRLDRNAPGLDR